MSTIDLNNLGKFRSFDLLPPKIIKNIQKYLIDSGYLLLEEYEYHLKNNENSFIIIKWDENYSLEIFTLLKVSKLQLHGKHFNCLVSFMYEYFDYNPIYSIYSYDLTMSLISSLFNKENFDLIAIVNTYSQFKEAEIISSEEIGVYDASKDSFDALLGKKSIKRKYKTITSNRNLVIEHITLNKDNCDFLINQIRNQHIERWAFEDIESGFLNDDYRNEFYKFPATNKIVSIVKDNDSNEIIALHYGFKLSNSLLWHTPLINIKFYEFSPLEILLKIVFEFCKENNIKYFDFGLGSEQYKNRFVNQNKYVYSYYYPLNLKSKIYLKVLKNNKNFINNQFKNLKKIKLYVNKILLLKSTIIFYSLQSNHEENRIIDERFRVIDAWEVYVDLCRKTKININKNEYSRFKNQNYFYCLVSENQILCSGWGTKENDFYVLEIDKKILFDCDIMLYDFNTPNGQRNKGYYKLLLKNIIQFNNESLLGIFAEKTNIHSNKAIKKVGFEFKETFRSLY